MEEKDVSPQALPPWMLGQVGAGIWEGSSWGLWSHVGRSEMLGFWTGLGVLRV